MVPHHVFILGLKKDVKAASKHDKSGLIAAWQPAIVKHMYWVAASTPENTLQWSDNVESKWRSLENHIVNVHHHNDPLYPKCAHPKRKRGQKKKNYMKRSKCCSTYLVLVASAKSIQMFFFNLGQK